MEQSEQGAGGNKDNDVPNDVIIIFFDFTKIQLFKDTITVTF